jgi:hypothetical protein
LVRISGSRAQRDFVVDTLLTAYIRAGRSAEAQSMLGRRGRRIPTSPEPMTR